MSYEPLFPMQNAMSQTVRSSPTTRHAIQQPQTASAVLPAGLVCQIEYASRYLAIYITEAPAPIKLGHLFCVLRSAYNSVRNFNLSESLI